MRRAGRHASRDHDGPPGAGDAKREADEASADENLEGKEGVVQNASAVDQGRLNIGRAGNGLLPTNDSYGSHFETKAIVTVPGQVRLETPNFPFYSPLFILSKLPSSFVALQSKRKGRGGKEQGDLDCLWPAECSGCMSLENRKCQSKYVFSFFLCPNRENEL